MVKRKNAWFTTRNIFFAHLGLYIFLVLLNWYAFVAEATYPWHTIDTLWVQTESVRRLNMTGFITALILAHLFYIVIVHLLKQREMRRTDRNINLQETTHNDLALHDDDTVDYNYDETQDAHQRYQ